MIFEKFLYFLFYQLLKLKNMTNDSGGRQRQDHVIPGVGPSEWSAERRLALRDRIGISDMCMPMVCLDFALRNRIRHIELQTDIPPMTVYLSPGSTAGSAPLRHSRVIPAKTYALPERTSRFTLRNSRCETPNIR